MWNTLIKKKLFEILQSRKMTMQEVSLAIGRDASWLSKHNINHRKRLDLDADLIPILDYLGIDSKKFLAEIIYEQTQQELRQIFA